MMLAILRKPRKYAAILSHRVAIRCHCLSFRYGALLAGDAVIGSVAATMATWRRGDVATWRRGGMTGSQRCARVRLHRQFNWKSTYRSVPLIIAGGVLTMFAAWLADRRRTQRDRARVRAFPGLEI